MIAESRSRPSSPAPQQPSPPSSNQATQSATQPITVQSAEDKRCPPPSLPSSSTPLAVKSSTSYTPQSDPPSTVTQQQSNSPAKQKRNERTRQQYKRRALHVTVQPSVKEVEHTKQTKPREHIVSERIKLVPWDWSTTSLWCWYAVIPWDGMIMMLLRCGASGMPRIGIG